MMCTLLLAKATPQPWRNGGGVTRELLAWPTAEAWRLRVSVAEISQDGPFSAFPGIARCFAVIDGAGVLLDFADGERRCGPDGSVVSFDGAAAPGCRLIDGTTQDLNLMVRSDAGTGAMQAAGPDEWRSDAPVRMLFCAGAGELRMDGLAALDLPSASLVFATQAAGQRWHWRPADGGTLAWWLSFQAHTA